MDKNVKRFAVGAAFAAGVGYVAGILTAPKSGKQTRKDIQDAVGKARSEAEKNLKALYGELNSVIDQAKDRSTKLSGAARTQLAAAISAALKAKDKVRHLLSAVHEGDAEDSDLQQAIKDATKAIEHLKAFMKKDEPDEKAS